MRCTNNRYRSYKKYRRYQNRKRQLQFRLIGSILVVLVIILSAFYLKNSRNLVKDYEESAYSNSIYQASLFADELCVTNEEVKFEEFYRHDEFHGALLFNLADQEVLYSERANERLYPASTTKLMTIYLALKYGNLKDVITVSEHAVDIPSDSSSARLEVGDQLTLEDLLYALMLPSGNDSAVAIAEAISGSEDEFVKLMNQEANSLGATNSHFMNPHGYHDDDHYTTAYDLYLIFHECIKYPKFTEVISSKGWETVITKKDGSEANAFWKQSNQFVNGGREAPKGIHFVGGKTGTTYEAGYCLVLYGMDSSDTPYISIIMGATSSRNLYDNMVNLWAAIPD